MAEKLIVDNRRARHDYHLSDRVEAGVALTGTEVKSLRAGQANLPTPSAQGLRLERTRRPEESPGGNWNFDFSPPTA